MPPTAAWEQLDAVAYVYLREIYEHDKSAFNTLRIVVEEAVVNHTRRVDAPPGLPPSLFEGTSPIEPVDGCKLFQLDWKHYLAYLVTEELVGSNAPNGYADQSYTGRILRTYSKSHFLDHIARDTGGHVQEVHHYKLICLDHLIDVVSYLPPEVTVIRPKEIIGEISPYYQ